MEEAKQRRWIFRVLVTSVTNSYLSLVCNSYGKQRVWVIRVLVSSLLILTCAWNALPGKQRTWITRAHVGGWANFDLCLECRYQYFLREAQSTLMSWIGSQREVCWGSIKRSKVSPGVCSMKWIWAPDALSLRSSRHHWLGLSGWANFLWCRVCIIGLCERYEWWKKQHVRVANTYTQYRPSS